MTSHERRSATGENIIVAPPADAPRGARGARRRRVERVQGGVGIPSRALRHRAHRDCAHVERRQPDRHDRQRGEFLRVLRLGDVFLRRIGAFLQLRGVRIARGPARHRALGGRCGHVQSDHRIGRRRARQRARRRGRARAGRRHRPDHIVIFRDLILAFEPESLEIDGSRTA